MQLGKITGESIAAYHQQDCFSNSKLKDFERPEIGPELYYGRYISKTIPKRKQTAPLSIGSALDILLLDGVHNYHSRVATRPAVYTNDKGEIKPWSGNAKICQGWLEGEKEKIVLSPDESELVSEMAKVAFENPDISALLEHGQPGITFRADFGFAVGQCRCDWYNPEGTILPSTGKHTGPYFIELKSCRSLISEDYGSFEKDFSNLGYHKQIALYREIICEVSNGAPFLRPFVLAIDKTEIVQAQLYDPSSRMLSLSHRAVETTLMRLQECYETGNWTTPKRTIRTLDLPHWEEKRIIGADHE